MFMVKLQDEDDSDDSDDETSESDEETPKKVVWKTIVIFAKKLRC